MFIPVITMKGEKLNFLCFQSFRICGTTAPKIH